MSISFIKTTIDQKTGVCTVTLHRPPVQSLNPAFLRQLKATFEELDANKAVRGILLKSEPSSSFSAGLDLFEISSWLEKDGTKAAAELIPMIGAGLSAPLRTSKPVAAVVKGHAIAGGMVLACACDFVALQKPSSAKEYLIGVTETRVGIPWPRIPLLLVQNHVGSTRGFREFAYLGDNSPVSRAFEMGFGDVFVDDAEAAALKWLSSMLALAPDVFALSKRQLNANFFRLINEPNTSLTLLKGQEEINQMNAKSMAANAHVIADFARSIKAKSKL